MIEKRFTDACTRRRVGASKSSILSTVAVMLCCLLLTITGVKAQTSATAQTGVVAPQGTFLIRNARIVTVSGPDIENGSLLIRNGKIEAVGANVTAPAGAEEINAQG